MLGKTHITLGIASALIITHSEYLSRQAIVQKADYEDPAFPAIILVVNDLFGIESFISNEIIERQGLRRHN